MMDINLIAFIGIGGLGFAELAVIAVVAIVLFGGRLPSVARNFGQTYANFRRQLADIQASLKTDVDYDDVDSKPGLPYYADVDEYDDQPDDFEAPPEED
ncbi:MAG: twin-arginine translocase TatA/TatE family subunit [Planctomycetota bacterium]